MRQLHLLILLLLITLSTSHATENESDLPLIAANRPDGHLYIFNLDDEPIRVTDEAVEPTFHLFNSWSNEYNQIWSPNGKQLIFVRPDGINSQIGVFDIETRETWYLDAHITSGVPLSFSLDGEYLVYTSRGVPEIDGKLGEDIEIGAGMAYPILAKRIRLEPDSEPETIQLLYHVQYDLGGGDGCRGEVVYGSEARRDYLAHPLSETPYGLLFGYSYDTYLGDVELNISSIRHTLSSDRTKLGYWLPDGFAILSLDTLETVSYHTSTIPNYMKWADNNDFLFYASLQLGENLYANLTEEEQLAFWVTANDCMFSSNVILIHRYDLNTFEDTVLYQGEHYAISSIIPHDDDIYFSVVPNAIPEWLDSVINNSCDIDLCSDLFFPDLYRLNLITGEVELILEDVFKVAIVFTE